MEYVMVPVPQEHAEEVLNHLRWNVGKKAVAQTWDDASIAQLYEQSDAITRSLLVAVAMAALDEREMTVSEIADVIECSDREVVGAVIEVNHLHQVKGAPPFILVIKELPANAAAAQAWDKRALVLAEGVAPLLRAVHAARSGDAPSS